MFMMMDDVGSLFWRFGKKLVVSHGESEDAGTDHAVGHKPPPAPPTIVHSPAAE